MNPGEGELSLLYPGEGESCLYPREGEDHQSLRDKVWKLYQGRGEENRAPGKIFFTEQRETKNVTSTKWHSLRRELLTMGETPITMTLVATKNSKNSGARKQGRQPKRMQAIGDMATQKGLTSKGKDRKPNSERQQLRTNRKG